MDNRSSFRKKWLYIVLWLAVLVISYLIITSRINGFWQDPWNIFLDFLFFLFFLIVWMAFFAQFVLPVKTAGDRQKIFDRLFRHLTGTHGPAVFIENGEIKEHSGETLKKGPGVVWLDSASAAITRTATAIKKTIGPGVHFTDAKEYIEKSGTLDLHIQSQKLSPKDGEKPFAEKKEDQPQQQYDEIQGRRRQVSAWTRNGVELVPDVSISFRVNTEFPAAGRPGSRFGYRTGPTNEDKEAEKKDKEIICRAILGEGINPYIDPESALHRVAWNRLPGMMAVDIWREYASKFTLDEFFEQTQNGSPTSPPSQPETGGTPPPSSPAPAKPVRKGTDDFLVRTIRAINDSMQRAIDSLEKRENVPPTQPPPPSPAPPTPPPAGKKPSKKTALQVINEMVKARLTQQFVDELDEYGKRTGNQVPSEEYNLLQIRGLKVLSVSISNVRLAPVVQEQLIKQWSANWLKFAKEESDQLDLRRTLIETSTRERTQCEYAVRLSQEIDSLCKKGNPAVEALLMAVLLRSRAMIRSGQYSNSLRRRMITELQEIDEMIKWMGGNT